MAIVFFSAYINPEQQIAPQTTEANGLTNVEGNLMLNGKRIPSKPRETVFQEFVTYLRQFQKRCILCAHNCKFDAPRLVRVIHMLLMISDFGEIIHGFTDTLPIIKRIIGKTEKGANTLTTLATSLNIPTDGAHNAEYDVSMLETIVERLGISEKEITSASKSWDFFVRQEMHAKRRALILQSLICLKDCASLSTRKKWLKLKFLLMFSLIHLNVNKRRVSKSYLDLMKTITFELQNLHE